MSFISNLIGTQPILALFLAIGLGYAVGQISIFGFSLGVGAVLFVGLFIGAIAPKANIAGPIGLVGLIMFLYGIGILYGRQFFEGLTGPGRKYNLLAFVAVIASLFVALGLGHVFGVKIGHTLGIFAGSMTSTATLQAALDTMKNSEPSIGYSVAYPFGVIGPILCFYFLTRRVKPIFPPKPARFHMGEVTIERLPAAGTRLGNLIETLPKGVQVAGVRQEHRNILPDPALELEPGDALLVAAEKAEMVDEVAAALGRVEPGRIAKDRGDLSYQRFFVSKQTLTGVRLADLPMPTGVPLQILHIRRYDVDSVPAPDPMLEIGDRVGVLVSPSQIAPTRAHFGDTVKSAAEFSYVSIGIGMVLGVLLGLVPIPVPGVGTRYARDRRRPANCGADRRAFAAHRSDQLGHAVAGQHRAAQFRANAVLGLRWASILARPSSPRSPKPGRCCCSVGAVVLLVTVGIVLLVGLYVLKHPVRRLARRRVRRDRQLRPSWSMRPGWRQPNGPDIAYAMIFPSATIVKVVAVQIVGLIVLGG